MNKYIQIGSQEELNAFINNNYTKKQIKTIAEFASRSDSPLFEYKGGFYRHFNQLLRARLEDQEADYDITGLNAFISSFSVNTDLISYRYVSFKEYITLLRNTLFKRTYEYPCFLSTTLIDNLYSMDDIKYKRLLIKILIPKGTKGIILPEVNPKNPEFELLLPYRLKLQRVAVKMFMIAN